jgi:hypothetical protein
MDFFNKETTVRLTTITKVRPRDRKRKETEKDKEKDTGKEVCNTDEEYQPDDLEFLAWTK